MYFDNNSNIAEKLKEDDEDEIRTDSSPSPWTSDRQRVSNLGVCRLENSYMHICENAMNIIWTAYCELVILLVYIILR